VEVYVQASLAECEKRDPKGLYAKARRGEIANMTGLQDPYEVPENPDIVLNTEGRSREECMKALTDWLLAKGFLLP
jgi:adenylylsulfate kinase-like enzyme